MKKLSSSNIELSSGTFYDADTEQQPQQQNSSDDKVELSTNEVKNGDVSIRSEEKPCFGKVKSSQKVNNSE